MASNLSLAIRGNLKATLESRKLAYLKGLKAGTQDSTDIGKNEIRQDIRRAFSGDRLPNTIRGDVFPSGNRLSYSPSAIIYSNAPHIIDGHSKSDQRRAVHASGLLVPIKGDGNNQTIRRHQDEDLQEALRRKWGRDNLFWLNRPGRNPVLMAKVLTRFRTRSVNGTRQRSDFFIPFSENKVRSDNETTSIPVATFVKNFHSNKRISTRELLFRAKRRHPARLAFHLGQHLRRSEQETALR